MNVLDYLSNRTVFIFFHLLAGALAVAVIRLDLFRAGAHGLTVGSTIYIFVLHAAALMVALAIDYSRQHAFFSRVRTVITTPNPLAELPSIPTPCTAEQRILSQLASTVYTCHTEEMLKHEEQSQLHSDFSNRWVHAVKTPVSVIDLLIQQSMEINSVEEAAALFDSIQEENERISQALDTMLGMARQERFSVDLLPEEVDLVEASRKVINKHRKEFIRYSIYPSIESHGSNTVVETDEKWITFVIDQLVSNAIKYTRARPSSTDNAHILIVIQESPNGTTLSIQDHGIGIPEHDLPRIFDPFFTGDNGRIVSESTGMGLFLARKICAALGHKLTVSSEMAQGTAVTITFTTVSITKL